MYAPLSHMARSSDPEARAIELDRSGTSMPCSVSPGAALHSYVKAYQPFGPSGRLMRRWLMPSYITLGLTFSPCRLVAGTKAVETGASPFVHGLSSAASSVEYETNSEGMWIELTPLGAARLFPVPGAVLRDRVTPLSDLLGADAIQLACTVLETDSWTARCAMLDHYLLDRILRVGVKVPDEVVWAWLRITCSGGQLQIADIIREVGCSRRHLAHRFSEVFGITPKAFGRNVRFERAFENLLTGNDTLSGIAIDCGYYDQAHLNRDMRAFTGTCPTKVLAARTGNGIGHEPASFRPRLHS